MSNLSSLTLNFIQIDSLSALGGLTNLRSLRLRSTNISDISVLEELTNLTFIDLADNQISDIKPLVDNTGLGFVNDYNTLYLSGNPLSDISINVYVPQLRDRGVDVYL